MSRSSAGLALAISVTAAGGLLGQPIGPEFHVNSYTTGYQRYPSVAEDGAGDFVVVWQSSGEVGANPAIYARRYSANGSPQSDEIRVSFTSDANEVAPSVASKANGDFFVVWTDLAGRDGSGAGVFEGFFNLLEGFFFGDVAVNSYTTGFQGHAKVASDAIGNATVVWDGAGPAGVGIYGRRLRFDGLTLGAAEFHVNQVTSGGEAYPAVGVSPGGAFMVVWQSAGDGSGDGISGRIYRSSGAPLTSVFRVNSFTPGEQRYPSVAAQDAGDFVVAWQSDGQDGSYWGIYAQRFEASGAPLGFEFRVNTNTTDYQFAPSVGPAPDGGFAVTWTSYGQDGSGNGIYTQRYDGDGAPIGGEFRVNEFTLNGQNFSSVDSRSGNLVIAWQSFAETGDALSGVYAAQRLLTNTDERVNTFTSGSQSLPAISADSSGDTVVVWQSEGQDGSGLGIYGQRSSPVGTPLGSEFHVSAFVAGDQLTPSVAASGAGSFVVVWESENEIFNYVGAIYGRRYTSGGAPVGSEFLVAGTTGAIARYPAVASDTSGSFVVVWMRSDLIPIEIHGRRYDPDGAPLGSEFKVTSTGFGPGGHPSVASSSAGFLVVWEDDVTDFHSIRGQRYASNGAALGVSFQVSAFATTDAMSYRPRVAADANGDFVVVWQDGSKDGSDYGVFGQRLDGSGAARGGEFRVNTFTTGRQMLPSVSVDSTGAFVVAWQGLGQDGSSWGVFAQRYDAAGAPVGSELRANGFAPASEAAPAVAYANGRLTIAFQAGGEGSGYGIYVRQPLCLPGDVNASGQVDVADVFYLINTLFASGPAPVCSGDLNGSGLVDVADVFYLINYLFAGGPPPV